MKTSFFYRVVVWFVIACSCVIVGIGCSYSWFLCFDTKKERQAFYFLVEKEENIEVSQSVIALQGGAGFVLPSGEVVLGVYFSCDAANEVLNRVQSIRKSSYLTVMHIEAEGSGDKAFCVALRCVGEVIDRLQHGLTQSKAAHLLQDLGGWLFYYGLNAMSTTEKAAKQLGEELINATKSVIYVGELRYFLSKSIASCALGAGKY